MVCEQSRSEVVNFECPYRMGIECEKECKIILNGEEMEEVNDIKYLGSVICIFSAYAPQQGRTEEEKSVAKALGLL